MLPLPHLPSLWSLMGASLAMLFALVVLETPAAAHFGAPHIDLPRLVSTQAPPAGAGAAEPVLAAADRCGEACDCCATGAMHAHCHPPAVLAARAEPAHHLASSAAAWSVAAPSAGARSAGAPPVPPPNAG